MRIFDGSVGQWKLITVDENIPLRDGRPLFSQPNGHELWVAMLEKAFAKFCGGYDRLDGGLTGWALNALTGDPVFRLQRPQGGAQWKRMELKLIADSGNKRAMGLAANPNHEAHSNDEVFCRATHMVHYHTVRLTSAVHC